MSKEEFLWPPACTISFYGARGRHLFTCHDRKLDLADSLAAHCDYTMILGMSSRSVKWKRWGEANLEKVEWLIRYDITFDGYALRMGRLSKVGQACTKEFLWRLARRPR